MDYRSLFSRPQENPLRGMVLHPRTHFGQQPGWMPRPPPPLLEVEYVVSELCQILKERVNYW
ncbi:MAG: hypothetical protein MUO26_15685 [Methanotrichaceae archaeon]|nr:hypothetical protein [Methanotrichaceae archaeon]